MSKIKIIASLSWALDVRPFLFKKDSIVMSMLKNYDISTLNHYGPYVIRYFFLDDKDTDPHYRPINMSYI